MMSDQLRQLRKRAGLVEQVNPQADHATILHASALDDPREQRHIDVAAADDNCSSRTVERGLFLQQSIKRCCAGAFGQRLLALKQHKDGGRDLVFIDGYDLVDVSVNNWKRNFAGATDS